MDFDAAIRAHADWKMKLSQYLRNPDKSLVPDVVAKDDQCALGKWIYGEGGKFVTHPEFANLKAAHARFHKAASDVIRKADTGKDVSEEVSLGGASEFSKASMEVTQFLMSMKRKAA